VIQVESVELKENPGMGWVRHGSVRLVEGVLVDVRIVLPTVGYRRTVRGGHLRGEVCRSLWGLHEVSISDEE
jgi:hypothetical protein